MNESMLRLEYLIERYGIEAVAEKFRMAQHHLFRALGRWPALPETTDRCRETIARRLDEVEAQLETT